MTGQNKKNNNRNLIILFVGLIIIGIVCIKLKNTEQLENKKEEETEGKKIYNQFKNAFSF